MRGAGLQSPRLGPSTRVALLIVGVGLWLSGGLWLLFHYTLVTEGEFGPQANPLEPWWLELHGAFAFAALWLFGLLWGVHVMTAWPTARHRLSGSALVGILVWLGVSGCLLYYVGNDGLRSAVSVLHWGLGLAAPGFYFLHRSRVPKRRAGKKDAPRPLLETPLELSTSRFRVLPPS